MSGQPSVNIGVVPIAQAYDGHPVNMRFVNNGRLTVQVHASSVALDTGNHHCIARSAPVVQVSPSTFTVARYGGETVTVTVPPDGAHDYGVLFVAQAQTGGRKSVTVQAAVGSQVTTGSHLTCGGKLAEVAPASGGLSPWLLVVALVVALVALVVLAVLARTWVRRSRRDLPPFTRR